MPNTETGFQVNYPYGAWPCAGEFGSRITSGKQSKPVFILGYPTTAKVNTTTKNRGRARLSEGSQVSLKPETGWKESQVKSVTAVVILSKNKKKIDSDQLQEKIAQMKTENLTESGIPGEDLHGSKSNSIASNGSIDRDTGPKEFVKTNRPKEQAYIE